jgi:tripartite-type tricarboxylate transporter receptor subunit TctC
MTIAIKAMLFGGLAALASAAAFSQAALAAQSAPGASASPQASKPAGYPVKSIRMIVPFETGSTTDTLARLVGRHLAETWGQPVVVDNRGGAGGNIGTEIVAKSAPDGYTVLMAAGSHAINPSLYRKLPYDALRDFTAVTQVGSAPQLLVASTSLGASTIRELVALAKAKPHQISYASGGNGSPSHLGMELLKSMAGIDLIHVPYKGGGPVLTALLSGEVQLYAGNIRSMMPLARAGKLKALAVTSLARSPAAPEVPTVAESGVPGYTVTAWWGMLVPARTPLAIVTALQEETARLLRAPAMRERLAAIGIDAVASTPREFDAFIREEMTRWAKVVRASGARID